MWDLIAHGFIRSMGKALSWIFDGFLNPDA